MTYVHTTGFTRGEVDEALWDRVDVDFYRAASRYVENWFPDLTGAIQRRPGFEMGAVYLSDSAAGFDTAPTLPLGADRVDCVLEPLSVGGREYLVQIVYWEDGGAPAAALQVWRLDLDAEPFRLHLESEASLAIQQVPEGAALSHYTSVSRVGPALFLTSTLFAAQRVFYDRGDDAVKIEAVAWNEELLGSVAVTKGSTTWTGTDSLFQEQVAAGDTIVFKGQAYEVDTVSSNTELTTTEAYDGPTLSGERLARRLTAAQAEDRMGGHPRLSIFHRGRLFLFTTEGKPTAMWASASQDPFTILAGGVHDDAPINHELLAEGVDGFVWVTASEQLYLGSLSGEYVIAAPTEAPITPTRFGFSRIGAVGGAPIPPALSDSATIFVSRGRNQILANSYEDAVQGYTSKDLSLLAGHLMEPGVRALSLRPATGDDRVPRLFTITEDRELRACALYDKEEVVAWSRLTPPTGDTPLALTSSSDQQYMAFCRQFPGFPDRVYIVRLAVPKDPRYVLDYMLPYGPAQDTVVLEEPHWNRTVAVISEDRGFLGFFAAQGDQLDLSGVDHGGTPIHIGLTFRSRLELLPTSASSQTGETTLNRRRRVVKAELSVRGAYQLFVNGVSLFGAVGTTMGTELPRQDGVFTHRLLGWGYRDTLVVEEATVYRARIISISREMQM